MKNSLNREIANHLRPFVSSNSFELKPRVLISQKQNNPEICFFNSYEEAFDYYHVCSNQTISFHHHLRNGDQVINAVCDLIEKKNLSSMTLVPSSIFPSYEGIASCIEKGLIKDIYTSYLNGRVSTLVQKGLLKGQLIMQTHGGRARAIESGEIQIDYAFLASPTVDKFGNGTGMIGKSSCGTLGYGMSDLLYAKKVILVTDNLVESIDEFQFDGKFVDGVIVVDSIGNREGIVSGTTKITRDPIGLKIAKDTAFLLNELGFIKPGFSMQTGAGGTSLAVVKYISEYMKDKNIHASFASGGITTYFVEMLQNNFIDKLYDVQCFDLDAVKSFAENKNHIGISASKYGNPFEENPICNQLDFVILGATEIDLDYNTNVTTDSFGQIIGGSGGHSDIAYGAKCSIVVSQLIKSRLSIVKEKVTSISTPGEDIDIFICERGISINPKRQDLIDLANKSSIINHTMKELLEIAYEITGIPTTIKKSHQIIGYIEYRDGTAIDTLYGLVDE